MRKEAGFTLIEIIVSLILIGIMASVAGMGIVAGIRGYMFARDNASVSQKAQLAMSRLNRTFMEVLDITTVGSSPTRVTYNRLSGGVITQETLYLDTTDNTIKIAVGGNASGGNALVDNVSSLALTYRKGTQTWVQGTDDFSLLSTVGVILILTRPDGGDNVTFSTDITPRNNANRGGSTSTTQPNPQTTCFVATAAFGYPDHPMVLLLREFRDRYLSTWAGGRLMVKMYYAGGPYLADLIRDRDWACSLTQCFLLPFVGVAFLMLHAPLVVPFIFLLSWAATGMLFKFLRSERKMFSFRPLGQKGSILIGLIVTMVVFLVLGAAMLSLTATSTFNQAASTSATKAYYLAEAGMRYAASEFRNAGDEGAKDNRMEALHNHNFAMSSEGSFHLDIYPYYFKTTTDPNGTVSLHAKFPGGVPTGMVIPNSGYLKIRSEDAPRLYTSYTQSGSTITFIMDAALPSFTINSNVLPVGVASSTTLSKGGNLTLSSGAGAFPLINGTFTIGTSASTKSSDNNVYAYKTRSGSTLQGITLSQTPTQAFTATVPASAYITSMKFVNVQSRGTFAAGSALEAIRTIDYSIPIGWVSGSGTGAKVAVTDTFEDLSHWFAGTGELGGHQIAAVDGNNALDVTSTYSPDWGLYSRLSLFTYNWSSTGGDLNQSWSLADHLLSYDAQVKIRVHSQNYYMAGMIFRVDASGQMYGVSYLRADKGSGGWPFYTDNDKVPNELCPLDKTAMIVLWQETPANTMKWLAYKTLTSADGVIDSNGRYLLDWSTLLVRIIEADSLSFDQGGPGTAGTLRYGDTITGATSGATAIVNGTPILTSGDWSTHNAAGWLTVSNVTKVSGAIQFQNGENLIVAGVVRARYTGNSRQKDNYIRVYYGNTTNEGTANANPLDNNRLADARISNSATDTLKWPVDDVADWAAANDAFTLVQWNNDLNLDAGDARLGTGSEANAIIRTNALTTPSSGTFTRTEVGLDTWGSSSTSVYFDDFGIQTAAPGQTQGFLPAIQR